MALRLVDPALQLVLGKVPHPRIHTITIDRRADLDAAQVDQIAVFESPEQPPLIDHRAKQRFEIFAIGAVSRRRHAQEAHILQWTSESPLGRGLGVMAFIYNDNATSSEVASKDSKPMGLHDGLDPGNGNLMAPCFETRFAVTIPLSAPGSTIHLLSLAW